MYKDFFLETFITFKVHIYRANEWTGHPKTSSEIRPKWFHVSGKDKFILNLHTFIKSIYCNTKCLLFM